MWVLYGLLVSVVLFCAGLIFCNVVTSGDAYHLDDLQRQLQKEHTYGLIITDLIRTDNAYQYDTLLAADTYTLHARTNSFDLLVSTDDDAIAHSPLMRWTMALQLMAVLCMGAIFVLIIILLISVFRAISQDRIFRRQSIRWLWAIGLLAILFTLSLDTSTYLERLLAYRLLEGTAWEPLHGFTLHVTRLFVGLIVLFIAEILRIGYTLQEEQDLTI
mgnify:CR=1 FL=1